MFKKIKDFVLKYYVVVAAFFLCSTLSLIAQGDMDAALLGVVIAGLIFYFGRKNKNKTKGERRNPTSAPAPTAQPVSRPKASRDDSLAISSPMEIQSLKDFIVLDTETTGLSKNVDKIVELCIIKIENNQPVEVFTTLLNPDRKIKAEASAVNGIYDKDVKRAPRFEELAPKIADMLGDNVIVGHNITFDLAFIQRQLKACGIKRQYRYVDTLSYASSLIHDSLDHKLQTLLKYFNIDPGKAHRAEDDTLATFHLFEALRRYERRGPLANNKLKYCYYVPPINDIVPTVRFISTKNPLYDKNIVFTGDLDIERLDAYQAAVNCGAILQDTVTPDTDYLVEGQQFVEIVGETGLSSKQRKARELNAEGKADIEFLTEAQFKRMAGRK